MWLDLKMNARHFGDGCFSAVYLTGCFHPRGVSRFDPVSKRRESENKHPAAVVARWPEAKGRKSAAERPRKRSQPRRIADPSAPERSGAGRKGGPSAVILAPFHPLRSAAHAHSRPRTIRYPSTWDGATRRYCRHHGAPGAPSQLSVVVSLGAICGCSARTIGFAFPPLSSTRAFLHQFPSPKTHFASLAHRPNAFLFGFFHLLVVVLALPFTSLQRSAMGHLR